MVSNIKLKKVIVIAEAGVNHNGNEKTAIKLIDAAKKSGADIIKFQSFKTNSLITKFANKPEYINKNIKLNKKSQYQILKELELSENVIKKLASYSKKIGIEFLSSPFDIESINYLSKIKVKRFKIPSGEITNFPYLVSIAKKKKPTILSTGMANLKEIEHAIKILLKYGLKKNDITVLHCTTDYPTSMKDVNLNAMISLKKKLKVKIGYSDHTMGIEVPITAAAMGATIIEKHITLNNKMNGPDHKASLEPNEFKKMVSGINNILFALGNDKKKPTRKELRNLPLVRKSIKAKYKIKKGEIFTAENITTKRPANGISANKWELVIGKKAKKNYKVDENIKL